MCKMDKKLIKKKNIIIPIILAIFFLVLIPKNSYATENGKMTNSTRVYFLSEITKGYGNGDCILLENYDSNGNKIYGLIDAGRKISKQDTDGNDSTSLKEFLKNHGVEKLDFFAITHCHSDHNGDALTVLDNFEVDKIYMKEFDEKWVTDGSKQAIYEDMLERAVANNIKVVGVSYKSLIDEDISPSRSQDFINNTKNAKENLFESFNEENTKFKFGSADIQIFNWEMFDETGNQYITGVTTDITREIVSNENNNSIVFRVTQGNKKAFFSGDMNNLDKNEKKGRIGDEDRLKDQIGKVDLLKLGHHGYQYSNTEDYINVLKPEYAVITNDLGGAYKDILSWFEENSVNYIYTTSDEYCVTATITENDVYLGFETTGIKNINNTLYYIPKNGKYADYTKVNYRIVYQETNAEVGSWKELKEVIDNNKGKIEIDDDNKTCTLEKLKIQLNNGGDWTADDTIEIDQTEQIELISSEDINIVRDTNLKDKPLFLLNGILSLGTKEMTGEITLDGNKNNVQASSPLIQAYSGKLDLYDNVTLCNNMNKITSQTSTGSAIVYEARGSAIYASNTIINMYGGDIKDNAQDIEYKYILPKEIKNNFNFETKGTGIYITYDSQFNMYGGKISNNEAQNHSKVESNESYSKVVSGGTINQRCLGVGIYSVLSKVNLLGGEISENIANNYSQMTLVKPSDETIKTNIDSLNTATYGTAIYTLNSKIKMSEGFLIADNSAEQHLAITMEENTIINNTITSGARGMQGYINSSDVNIEGGEIRNGSWTYDIIGAIKGSINDKCYGGGLCIYNSSKFKIENLNINNCQSHYGGGLYIDNSDGMISNSSVIENKANYGGGLYTVISDTTISNTDISNNKAEYGGGIYIGNTTSNTNINDSTITSNKATDASGGGIYAYGNLNISGNKTKISNNYANSYGGGIMLRGTGIINNGEVSNNTVNKYVGGGVAIYDGFLTMNNGVIKNNTAKTTGGGVDFSNKGIFCFNGGTVENNTAGSGNEIYPNYSILNDSSKIYTIDNNDKIITNIDVKTTVSEFKEKIKSATDYQVKDKNGNELSESDYIGTECKIVTSLGEYTLIVTGDLNGTGDIDLNDLAQAQKINLELIESTRTNMLAADLNKNGTIDINDLAKLQKIFLEKN